jgi:DNA-binding LytR/AlgR family response regulator
MKVILVDDEELALEELGFFLKQTPGIEILGSYMDPAEALEKIITREPDVVFLDIEMRELNGFLIAELILKMKKKTRIVFATAFDAYAIKAFEIGAIDYVLKPFSKERLDITLRKLIKNMSEGNHEHPEGFQTTIEKQVIRRGFKKVPLQTNDGFILISPGDISYFVAQKDEIQAVIREELAYRTSEPLNYWEDRLKDQKFFRCHRSFLINLDKVEEIFSAVNTPYILKIKGLREEVPVSKTYVKDFKRLLDL